jgi:hypothetical protein
MLNNLENGLYFNLPADNYHAHKAISASGLTTLAQNDPKIFWHESPFNKDREFENTRALSYGQVFHQYVLEGDKFNESERVKKGCKTTTMPGKVSESDFEKFKIIKKRLENDKYASNLLGLECKKNIAVEVSLFWDEPVFANNGEQIGTIPAKCRYDLISSKGIVVDLKTIDKKNLSDSTLISHIHKYGYHRQLAWYTESLNAIHRLYEQKSLKIFGDYDKKWFNKLIESKDTIAIIVFASKKAPHICRSIELIEEDLFHATVEINDLKRTFLKNYQEYGDHEWPSIYENTLTQIKL